jgi:GAF domain-containing protein
MSRALQNVLRIGSPDGEDATGKPSLGMRALQVLLFCAGAFGAYFHAFPLGVHAEHENYPNLDIGDIAWLAVILLALWLPDISEVEWGGFSIKTKQLKKASSVYEESLKNLAQLLQKWSTRASFYVEQMTSGPDELLETKEQIYGSFVRDRMAEAYEMLATKPNETLRLGLWLFDPVKKQVVFVDGFHLKPKKANYDPGEGLIGKAFVHTEPLNEADVRLARSYSPSRVGEDPPYRAVMCEPVVWDTRAIGVITVDRSTAGEFDDISVQVARGLAAQCALAVKTYELLGEGD